MMQAALMRGQRGPMLIAALMALVLLLSAGWAGSLSCDPDRSSGCACPCESGEGASEGQAPEVARRPDCCASQDPTRMLVAGVVGDPPEAWAWDVSRPPAPRDVFSVLRSGLPRQGMGRGPPSKLRMFLRHQAFLI